MDGRFGWRGAARVFATGSPSPRQDGTVLRGGVTRGEMTVGRFGDCTQRRKAQSLSCEVPAKGTQRGNREDRWSGFEVSREK